MRLTRRRRMAGVLGLLVGLAQAQGGDVTPSPADPSLTPEERLARDRDREVHGLRQWVAERRSALPEPSGGSWLTGPRPVPGLEPYLEASRIAAWSLQRMSRADEAAAMHAERVALVERLAPGRHIEEQVRRAQVAALATIAPGEPERAARAALVEFLRRHGLSYQAQQALELHELGKLELDMGLVHAGTGHLVEAARLYDRSDGGSGARGRRVRRDLADRLYALEQWQAAEPLYRALYEHEVSSLVTFGVGRPVLDPMLVDRLAALLQRRGATAEAAALRDRARATPSGAPGSASSSTSASAR